MNPEYINKPGKTDTIVRYAAAAILAFGAVKLIIKPRSSVYDTLTDDY